MMKKYLIMVVLLISFSLLVSAGNTIGISIKAENSEVNDMVLLGGQISAALDENYLVDGYFGTDFAMEQIITEFDLLRKFLPEKNYYVGLGYKYLKNDDSKFADENTDGGKITQNMVYVKFVGKNNYEDYKLTTDLSYSPYGNYRFAGNQEKMNSWYGKLSVEKKVYENLSVLFSTSFGYDKYKQIDTNVNSYSFVINFGL